MPGLAAIEIDSVEFMASLAMGSAACPMTPPVARRTKRDYREVVICRVPLMVMVFESAITITPP